MEKRIVYCEDAIVWLNSFRPNETTSFITSLPDYSEFPSLSLYDWQLWFIKTAGLIMQKTSPDGVSIFFQSDIKHDGEWIDKGFLIQKAAQELGHRLLWHKIFCRVPPGKITFGRPAYSHLLCFSKMLKVDVSKSTPDVFDDAGEKSWERGMLFEACLESVKYISRETSSTLIINPFCGHGSSLAMADYFGMKSIGIERSPRRAQRARLLQVNMDEKSWSEEID